MLYAEGGVPVESLEQTSEQFVSTVAPRAVELRLRHDERHERVGEDCLHAAAQTPGVCGEQISSIATTDPLGNANSFETSRSARTSG